MRQLAVENIGIVSLSVFKILFVQAVRLMMSKSYDLSILKYNEEISDASLFRPSLQSVTLSANFSPQISLSSL